jgi:CheY-like chemotaxis protein
MEKREQTAGTTRVLVVDDSAVARRVFAGLLQRAGCHVRQAADGLAALEELRSTPADVVVTDISMPRLDGLGLLAALRSHEPRPEVVLLTGSDEQDAPALAEALRLGAHAYVPKNASAVEAVVSIVQRAAARRRDAVGPVRRTSPGPALAWEGRR